jgi:hypothetical protein
MEFEIIGSIKQAQTFAVGSGIREIARIRRAYGNGKWRKRKGYATIRFENGQEREAEIHWYEATGIGKREFKIKRFTK